MMMNLSAHMGTFFIALIIIIPIFAVLTIIALILIKKQTDDIKSHLGLVIMLNIMLVPTIGILIAYILVLNPVTITDEIIDTGTSTLKNSTHTSQTSNTVTVRLTLDNGIIIITDAPNEDDDPVLNARRGDRVDYTVHPTYEPQFFTKAKPLDDIPVVTHIEKVNE